MNHATQPASLVTCEEHGDHPHPHTTACVWPHYVTPTGTAPSMTAIETLDPREAINEVNGYHLDGPAGVAVVNGHVVPASWAARR